MGKILRDSSRPNWIAPAVPEIIEEADGIPDQALHVMEAVNYGLQPWIFEAFTAPIPEVNAIVPNVERIAWTDDQRLPR